ncbi:MAG: hypothetical protein ACTH31_09085 [Pseudoclavibacter sp.]
MSDENTTRFTPDSGDAQHDPATAPDSNPFGAPGDASTPQTSAAAAGSAPDDAALAQSQSEEYDPFARLRSSSESTTPAPGPGPAAPDSRTDNAAGPSVPAFENPYASSTSAGSTATAPGDNPYASAMSQTVETAEASSPTSGESPSINPYASTSASVPAGEQTSSANPYASTPTSDAAPRTAVPSDAVPPAADAPFGITSETSAPAASAPIAPDVPIASDPSVTPDAPIASGASGAGSFHAAPEGPDAPPADTPGATSSSPQGSYAAASAPGGEAPMTGAPVHTPPIAPPQNVTSLPIDSPQLQQPGTALGPIGAPGSQQTPGQQAPGQQGPSEIYLADISIARDFIRSPQGVIPAQGAQLFVHNRTQMTSSIPVWAIVLAIVGFFILTFFSLLFLLVKEQKFTGGYEVVATGPGGTLTSFVPVNQQNAGFIWNDLNARAEQARAVIAGA